MTFIEEKMQSGEGETYIHLVIRCDVCEYIIYSNEVGNHGAGYNPENGLYICTQCTRKLTKNSLKKFFEN